MRTLYITLALVCGVLPSMLKAETPPYSNEPQILWCCFSNEFHCEYTHETFGAPSCGYAKAKRRYKATLKALYNKGAQREVESLSYCAYVSLDVLEETVEPLKAP